MNRRSLVILTAAGAGLLAILLLARVDWSRGDSARGLHAPGLAARLDALQSLRVSGAGNRVIATVERGPGGWMVAEKGGHRADFERFRDTLRALSEARRVERKTALAEHHARLGVEDVSAPAAAGYLLELDYGEAHPADRFIVGRRAGAGMAYIRTAGDDQSWMVSADFDLSGQTREWLDRAIIDLGSSSVRRVVLERGSGDRLEIAKQDSGDLNFTPANMPEGRELSYGSIANSIGSALANVEANDVRPAAEVAGLARAVLARYEAFDGLAVELDVREQPAGAAREGDSDGAEAGPRYWVLFSASVGEPAASPPPEGAPAAAEDARAGPPEQPAEEQQPPPTAAQRAAELNAALGGWAYELPLYKSDQWFKKLDDLLKDE